jgi:hypothetical protein
VTTSLELTPAEPPTGNINAKEKQFQAELAKDKVTAVVNSKTEAEPNPIAPDVIPVVARSNGSSNANNGNTGNILNPDGNKSFPYQNLLSNPETPIEVVGEQLRGMTAQINEAPSPMTHKINDQQSVTYHEFAVPGPGGKGLRLFRVYIPTGTSEQKMAKVIRIRDNVGSSFKHDEYVNGPAGLQQIIGDTKRVLEDQARTISSSQGYIESYNAGMASLDDSQKKIVRQLIPVLKEGTKSDQQSQVKLMQILNAAQAEMKVITTA